MKVEQTLSDGRTNSTFPNGTKKEISADRKTITTRFYNGDVKKVKPDQTVVCVFCAFLTQISPILSKRLGHGCPFFPGCWGTREGKGRPRLCSQTRCSVAVGCSAAVGT